MTESDPDTPTRFSARTAMAVVVANMIGTGVFTSLGYQLLDIQSGFAILLLWGLGGLAALCGALCYGELGAALLRDAAVDEDAQPHALGAGLGERDDLTVRHLDLEIDRAGNHGVTVRPIKWSRK